MEQVKRKSFSFEETDLEWINPLLIEWAKENEGKKQSDLIVQLLRDYKLEIESMSIEDESKAEDITPSEKEKLDYFGRVRKVPNVIFDELESRVRSLPDELRKGYEGLVGNIRKLNASERVSEVLTNTFDNLESGVRRLFARSQKEARETRVEDLEAEIKRLQTMMNELKSEHAEQEKEE